jgi:hypothetical protein
MSKKTKAPPAVKPPADVLATAAVFTHAGASFRLERSFGAWWLIGTISEGPCTQWFRHDATRSVLDLERISTPEAARGQGHAKRLFARIFVLADQVGARITTRALTQSPRTFSQNALLDWYTRIGLTVVQRHRAGAVDLERLPRMNGQAA